MIAKGNHHAHGVKLGAYLMKAEAGERTELIDTRGFGMCDLRDGFRIEQQRAKDGTKAEKPFFHIQLRGAYGEGLKLSEAQWLEIADRCDKALGLVHQPRAASLHIDRQTGDKHLHLAYSLVAEKENGQGYVKKLGLHKLKLQDLAREIERDYGLQIVSSKRRGAKAANRREFEESRRLGTSIKDIRGAILTAFEKSDNGRAFAAAMQAQGFEVAAGDRRDCLVVVDHAGGQHALNKKLTGKTLAEIRQRLGDLDRAQLPSVEQAQAIQLERKAEREALQTREAIRGPDAPEKPNTPSHGPENRPSGEKKPLPNPHRMTAPEILAGRSSKSDPRLPSAVADRELSSAADHAERGVRKIFGGLETAVSRAVEAVAAPLEGITKFFGDMFSAPKKITRDEANRAEQVREEKQEEAAWVLSAEQQEARFRELQEQMAKQDRYRVVRREKGIGDDLERGLERER